MKRNGENAAYRVSYQESFAELLVGRTGVFLPANSVQVYQIRYRTHGHIQEAEQFDGLYWNVTGSNWPFPILEASAAVSFPKSVTVGYNAAFTGPDDTKGRNFQVHQASDRFYRASTTAPLAPGERFAIAVGWPKGAVSVGPPSLMSHIPPERFAVFVSPFVAGLVLFVFWLAVGRDPKRAPLRREFEPPEGMDPAAVRFLYHRYFDYRCFSAALLNMAVKGALRIVEETPTDNSSKPKLRLEPLETQNQVLTPAEQAAYHALFPTNEGLLLGDDSADGEREGRTEAILERQLSAERGGTPYLRNAGYTAAGGVLGLISWLLVPLIAPGYDLTHNASVQWLIAAGSFGIVTFLFTCFWFMPTIFPKNLSITLVVLGIMTPVSAIILAIAYALILGRQDDYGGEVDLLLLASGALFGFFVVLFHELLVAPTKEERKLLDGIEGLCLYLHGGIPKRPDYRSAPERTPELFECLLPYAVALEFVDDWRAQFDGVIGPDYRPKWYVGKRFNAGKVTRQLTRALTKSRAKKRKRNRSFFRLGASMSRWT